MKKLILAVAAATLLGGCVAVPVYDSGGAYYAPAVPAIGVYVAPPAVHYRYSNRGYYRDGYRYRDSYRYRR